MHRSHSPAVRCPVHVASAISGLTLPEVMITLLIISISLATGVPALDGWLLRQRAQNDIRQLQTLIDTTRSLAVNLGSHATFCPLDNSQRCHLNWNAPLTLFQDRNGNRQLDANEPVIQQITAADDQVVRYYPNRALMFNERGFADLNNGSLSYCRRLPNNRFGASVWIISRMGRVRIGRDSNSDGVPETAGGQNIPCD